MRGFNLVLFSLFVMVSGRGNLEKYGLFELLLHSHMLKCDLSTDKNLDVRDIGIRFYDFNRNIETTNPIFDAASNILQIDSINADHTWVVFVPGFNAPVSSKTDTAMKNAFKNLSKSYYILVDHYVYTAAVGSYKDSYERAVTYVCDVGKAVAVFLKNLYDGGVPLEKLKVIGHSLGSQMLGHTGQHFKYLTGSNLKRITGLDPAGPCFSNSEIENQLRSGVADYVEIFHCNRGGLGTSSVLGDVDYFANNNGEFQPHCDPPLIPDIFGSVKAAECSHVACSAIYASTVDHQDWFLARKCDSYKSFKRGDCNPDITIAGFWTPGTATGVYYFSSQPVNDN